MTYYPLVSIIIPVYNGEHYMREAIDSALSQTYQNIEVIVINDGSPDDGVTESIASSYGNRIRYFLKENGGCASALNYGITKMRGEWFSWLSHDDIYYPQKIEREIQCVIDNQLDPTKTIVSCEAEVINEYGDIKPHPTKNDIGEYTNGKFVDRILFSPALNGCGMLIPRAIVQRVGSFNEAYKYILDWDYWLRAATSGFTLYRIGNEILVKNRIHSQQVSVRHSGIQQSELNRSFHDAVTECISFCDTDTLVTMYSYAVARRYGNEAIILEYKLNETASFKNRYKINATLLKTKTELIDVAKKIYWAWVRRKKN